MRCSTSTYPTEVEHWADQNLLGLNLYSLDFSNPKRNMRINLEKIQPYSANALVLKNGESSALQNIVLAQNKIEPLVDKINFEPLLLILELYYGVWMAKTLITPYFHLQFFWFKSRCWMLASEIRCILKRNQGGRTNESLFLCSESGRNHHGSK